MRNFVTTLMFAGASLLGTVGIVTYADPAVAATPTVAIHYSPAEITSVDGRAAIAKRIRSAASQLCFTAESGQGFAEMACREQILARADKTLGEAAR
jgi:UrcA family protein